MAMVTPITTDWPSTCNLYMGEITLSPAELYRVFDGDGDANHDRLAVYMQSTHGRSLTPAELYRVVDGDGDANHHRLADL